MNVEEVYVIERLEGDQWRYLYSDSDHEVRGGTICAFMDAAEADKFHDHLLSVNGEKFEFRVVPAAIVRTNPGLVAV